MTETVTAEPVAAPTEATKTWMTVKQAAKYADYDYETVRRQCVEYQRHRDRGLRCTQRGGANGHYRIHLADLDRWIEGLPPARTRRSA